MQVASGGSTEAAVEVAVERAFGRVTERLGGRPDLLLVHATATYDPDALAAALRRVAPGVPVHGGSSCGGVMTEAGFHSDWGTGLAMFGVRDPGGAYGVGAAPVGDDPAAAAAEAARMALERARRPGEVPGMVLMTAAPGAEERLIEGLEAWFGPKVVIAGGSSADPLTGETSFQLANGGAHRGSVSVAALFPTTELLSSFHSGYEPTEHKGVVTRASGRTVHEIDGRPAGAAYEDWTGGLVSEWSRTSGGPLLTRITMQPLGRVVGLAGGQPYYLLSHPKHLSEDGALTFLTEIPEGSEVVLLRGTQDNLASRAGRVVRSAMESTAASVSEVAGGLVVYCAGCMLTVYGRMDEVAASVNEALGGRPFLGTFTFGEQGCFVGGENRHGNLMICATLFGR